MPDSTIDLTPLGKLSPEHLAMLGDGSGIAEAVIIARGYRTVTDTQELRKLGFAKSQCLVPTLLLPVPTTDGSNSLYTHRPDLPRVIENKRKRNPDQQFPVRMAGNC